MRRRSCKPSPTANKSNRLLKSISTDARLRKDRQVRASGVCVYCDDVSIYYRWSRKWTECCFSTVLLIFFLILALVALAYIVLPCDDAEEGIASGTILFVFIRPCTLAPICRDRDTAHSAE